MSFADADVDELWSLAGTVEVGLLLVEEVVRSFVGTVVELIRVVTAAIDT